MDVLEELKKEVEEEMKEKENDRGVLDILLQKTISRKLIVWIAATVFLAKGTISADEWSAISMGYIGIEGFVDLATRWKAASK